MISTPGADHQPAIGQEIHSRHSRLEAGRSQAGNGIARMHGLEHRLIARRLGQDPPYKDPEHQSRLTRKQQPNPTYHLDRPPAVYE